MLAAARSTGLGLIAHMPPAAPVAKTRRGCHNSPIMEQVGKVFINIFRGFNGDAVSKAFLSPDKLTGRSTQFFVQFGGIKKRSFGHIVRQVQRRHHVNRTARVESCNVVCHSIVKFLNP